MNTDLIREALQSARKWVDADLEDSGRFVHARKVEKMLDAAIEELGTDQEEQSRHDRIRLTREQIQAHIAHVYKTGHERKAGRPDFNEVDFFMGASVIFFALECQELTPAAWVLAPMIGESVLEKAPPEYRSETL